MKILQLDEINQFTDKVCFEVKEKFGHDSLQGELREVVSFISDHTENLDQAMQCCVRVSNRDYQFHTYFVNGEQIIENIAERAQDEFPDGHADSYLDDVSKEKQEELEVLILNWLEQNASQPKFYYQGAQIEVFKLSADVFKNFGITWGEK